MSTQEISQIYQKSYDLEAKQRYQDAISVLYPIVKAYASSYTVNYRLGWLYYLKGNFTNSKSHYQKALLVYPRSVEVLNSMTLIAVVQENWVEAEVSAKRVLEIDFYNHYANLYLIQSLKAQGKFSLAQSQALKMLQLFPANAEFMFQLGEAYFLDKNFQKAAYYLESAWVLNPYHTKTLKLLKQLPKLGAHK